LKLWPPIVALGLVAGCARFHPQPLSPAESAYKLESRSLDNPELKTFLEKHPSGHFKDRAALLVAQLTGQLGAACATVKLPPWICTINPWLNQEWPNPTDITLVGGPTVTGTEILVIPEGGTPVSSISAARILAANIPSFILTSETVSVAYGGLTTTALGNAR